VVFVRTGCLFAKPEDTETILDCQVLRTGDSFPPKLAGVQNFARNTIQALVSDGHKVVSMNLILYGSLATVAYSKSWCALVCNFLDMMLVPACW